jgi:hypothetical protein
MATPESHIEVELEALVDRAEEIEVDHHLWKLECVLAEIGVFVESVGELARAHDRGLTRRKRLALLPLLVQLEALHGRLEQIRQAASDA